MEWLRGLWRGEGDGLLEGLERREGVARLEFQPLQKIAFSGGRGINCGS